MQKMNVLIIGAGAIGTYIGGSLVLAGHQASFLEQPKAVEELRRNGLEMELRRSKKGPSQNFHVPPQSFNSLANLEEALNLSTFDVAIFALKSFDTVPFLEAIGPVVHRFPPVLCLSNGVDNEQVLAQVLGQEKVIAGTVTSSVGRRGIGNIVLERLRGMGVAGTHPLSQQLVDVLNNAGLNAELIPYAADMKWSKMLTNLPANATAAILNMTAAEVFSHPGLFKLEMQMMREALDVMEAIGVRVVNLPGVPVKALALGIRLPGLIGRPLLQKAIGSGRGGKMPSFHIDLHSGRQKSEVEWLNGAVVRFGEQAAVSTPVNKILTETLMGLTRGEIPLEAFSRQPERLLDIVRRGH